VGGTFALWTGTRLLVDRTAVGVTDGEIATGDCR
jgi:hypothetical protein